MEVTSQLAQNLEAMAPFYTGKHKEAFRTLVESLVQMTTFISRIFLKLVELQFKVPSQRLDLTNFLKIYDIKRVISAK